jgi:hypothetical protein
MNEYHSIIKSYAVVTATLVLLSDVDQHLVEYTSVVQIIEIIVDSIHIQA